MSAASVAGFVFIWWLVTYFELMEPVLLVSPGKVFSSALSLTKDGSLPIDTVVSLVRVLEGFFIGFLVALPLGMLMGLSSTISNIVDPVVELIRPIPPIAWIPLAILWFGIGEASKLFIISYGAFFPILVNTMAGFRAIESIHIRAAETLGASKLQIFRHVMLKSAFPHIVVGLRLGMGLSFLVLVAAELIASESGLGYLIQEGRYHFMTDKILVGMVMIGVLGFLLNKSLLELEKYLVKWRPFE
jgi:ABC-type nitrate/sulfonate/bicarbonate transport system permease component